MNLNTQPTGLSAERESDELDAWECSDCGGDGRVTVYCDVTHQLGTDTLPFWETCPTCDGLKFCGPDAKKRAALPCTLPGLEVSEATQADFVDTLAGDLELAPIEPDEFTLKLQRAGFAPHPRRRSSDRAEANDWARSRAETDNAHRNEVAAGVHS